VAKLGYNYEQHILEKWLGDMCLYANDSDEYKSRRLHDERAVVTCKFAKLSDVSKQQDV
jgi:hypothetical protein